MPSLIQVWGWAPWVVLKDPQMVLIHSENTAGPNASLTFLSPPTVSNGGLDCELQTAALAQLSHFLKATGSGLHSVSHWIIHRSLQLNAMQAAELTRLTLWPASLPGPARMNPSTPVPRPSETVPLPHPVIPTTEFQKGAAERAPAQSAHNSASCPPLPRSLLTLTSKPILFSQS